MIKNRFLIIILQMTAFIGVALFSLIFLIISKDELSEKILPSQKKVENINWSRYDKNRKLLNIVAEKVDYETNSDQVLIYEMQANFYYANSTVSIKSPIGQTTTKTKILIMPNPIKAVWHGHLSTVKLAIQHSEYQVAQGLMIGGQVTIRSDGYWLRGDSMRLDRLGNAQLTGRVRARF